MVQLDGIVFGPNGTCSAQSNWNKEILFQSQSDLDQLNACTSFHGLININITNSSSVTIPAGLTTIIGFLRVGGLVKNIEADGLTKITTDETMLETDNQGTLIVDGETSLSKLSFPKLADVISIYMPFVSGLQIIDGFPTLSKVYFDLYLNGTFINVLFPNLKYVGVGFTVTSTDSNFQCPLGILQPGTFYRCGYTNNITEGVVPDPTMDVVPDPPIRSSATKHLGISSEK